MAVNFKPGILIFVAPNANNVAKLGIVKLDHSSRECLCFEFMKILSCSAFLIKVMRQFSILGCFFWVIVNYN